MPDRPTVFIHIGTPKTGTTYLQGVLHANRPALREAGLLYPGTQRAHFWASEDLRGTYYKGSPDRHVPGAWPRLVREVRSWPQRSLIDHESFGKARQQAVTRAFADLDFAEVHVVVTARDLARQLPAMWQEGVKNGGTRTFAEYLAAVQDEQGHQGRNFWVCQNLPAILARWGRTLPPERVHVVTVPPPEGDPALLWQRFAGLLGIDPDSYDTRPRGANTSLGAAEAAVLRRFNVARADGGLPWPIHAALIKHDLAPTLAARRGAAIEVPEPTYEWAIGWSERMVKQLENAGYDVVGDLDELVPRTRPTGEDPDAPPGPEHADAAAAAMVRLAAIAAESPRGRVAARRVERGPVARKAEEMVRRVPLLGRLRARLPR